MERNFNEVYQEIYKNGIKELTNLRKARYVTLIIFVVLFIFTILVYFYERSVTPLLVLLVFVNFISLFFTAKAELDYRKSFKDLVIEKLVSSYNSNFSFRATSGISRAEYSRSGFDITFDRFYAEDLIQGRVKDKYKFKMSQVKVQDEREVRDSDGNYHTEVTTLFYGLFGYVDIADVMLTNMDITPNSSLRKYNTNRIEVDSSEFEKRYDMLSIDKVRTMEIFTSDIIEKFNKFYDDTGYVMQIRIVPNRIFFRISCGDAFEAPTFKNALSYDYLYKNFRMIEFPVSIIAKIIENAIDTER